MRVGVRPKYFLPHRSKEREMRVLTEVLLGDLNFHHQRGPGHGAEQGMERLARLEVERYVLLLEQHVVAEHAVERDEFIVRMAHAVAGGLASVDESQPHKEDAVRRHRLG